MKKSWKLFFGLLGGYCLYNIGLNEAEIKEIIRKNLKGENNERSKK